MQTGKLILDERMLIVYGYEPRTFSGGAEEWKSRLFDADREVVDVRFKELQEGKKVELFEFRIIHKKTGEIRTSARVAASKLASLGEIAGSIAQEINNPLAIIGILAQKLKMVCQSQGSISQSAAENDYPYCDRYWTWNISRTLSPNDKTVFYFKTHWKRTRVGADNFACIN